MFKKFISLFFLSWSGFIFLSSGIVESQDGLQYLTIARQIYYHRSLELPEAKFPFENIPLASQVGREGKEFSPTGFGYSLALIPAVVMEDLFNRVSGISAISNFPLNNDWPIMLFGSMANAFFGAVFVSFFFLFLKTFSITDRHALLLSLTLFMSSNLLVYTKHGFAHMMFVAFAWASFFFIRMYALTRKLRFLSLGSIAYGIVLLTYNPTFILLAPSLLVYYLLSIRFEPNHQNNFQLRILFRDLFAAALSILPFVVVYVMFNWIRFGGFTVTGYGSGSFLTAPSFRLFVSYEGIWGLLFSPGKSVLLFSPVLMMVLLFWFKLKKKHIPEVITAITTAVIYVIFFGSLIGGKEYFPWHGEASFGPRYLLPILPFGLLLAGLIFRELSKIQRRMIFIPILLFGFAIQMIGVLIPYQVRFTSLTKEISLNGYRFTYDTYANFIPRFSPIFSMSRWLAKKIASIPTFYVNPPQVFLVDGAYAISDSNTGAGRVIESIAELEVDKKMTGKQIDLGIKNSISTSSSTLGHSAEVKVIGLSGELQSVQFSPNEEGLVSFRIPVADQNQRVQLQSFYLSTDSARPEGHVLAVTSISVDGVPMSLERYSYPYVSAVSKALWGQKYAFWGNENIKEWDLWNMRSINYVHTFDLWWLRPFHYWDLPRNFYLSLFAGNVTIFLTSFLILRSAFKKNKKKFLKKK